MRCTSPATVGFQSDGKTLCWSSKKYSKEFAPFQLPCGKCISCRLIQAREKAIRCVHEASLYENNTFLTLTYSEENLESPFLIYDHAQKFLRDLRYRYPLQSIPYVATGEYGGQNKRPHFHLLLFNFDPGDKLFHKKNKYGDILYTSKIIDEIWSRNDKEKAPSLLGPVDLSTAGYVCRYQLKKLEHGVDADKYKPKVEYSKRYAIGKKWIEQNWEETFTKGYVQIDSPEHYKIPRYYEDWLKKNHPLAWENYVITKRTELQAQFRYVAEKEEIEYRKSQFKRQAKAALLNRTWTKEKTKNQMRNEILIQKTKNFKTEDI